MTNSAEKYPNSGTTGFQPLALVPLNEIGSRLAAIGCGKRLTVSAGLSELRPADTDHRLEASLERISGRRPALLTQTLFPNDAPAYSLVSDVRWACPVERLPDAIALIEGAFRSAPEDRIAAALLKLRMLTMGRQQQDATMQEAEAVIWIEQLRGYPGDVVLDVLSTWTARKDGKWWPSWHDVEAALKFRCDRRMALLNFVRSLASRPAPAPALEHAMPSTEDRARAVDRWETEIRPAMAAKENAPAPVRETPDEALERLRARAEKPMSLVVGGELATKLEAIKEGYRHG